MRTAVFLLLMMLAAPVAYAAADNALLAKIQNAYSQLKAFEAEFDQTLTHKQSGSVEKRKGRIAFQKPLSVHWQTAKPHEEILVVNPKEIWDYLPDEQLAYRYAPELIQDSRNIVNVLTGQARLDKDFDIKPGGSRNGLTKLILYPREPNTQMVEAAIWVDPGSGAIQRANVIDFYGNSNDVAFRSFKPQAKIDASRFNFKPPKGTEIEDRIEQKVPERELFK